MQSGPRWNNRTSYHRLQDLAVELRRTRPEHVVRLVECSLSETGIRNPVFIELDRDPESWILFSSGKVTPTYSVITTGGTMPQRGGGTSRLNSRP